MIHRTRSLTAVSLLLAAQTGWAFSPYYPQPRYAHPPGVAPVYGYPRAAPIGYPRYDYRAAPPVYYPQTQPGRVAPQHRPVTARPVPATVRTERAGGSPTIDDRTTPEQLDSKAIDPPGPDDHRAEFLARLRPLVERENARLLALRDELSGLLAAQRSGAALSEAERKKIRDLARRYRVDGDPLDSAQAAAELLDKVDVVPVSLALAQAANESAWGKSRFAREGNNLFGIWTYDESQGIVPRNRQPGKKHLVRRFDSIADSVRYYIFTLNSHPAYVELRAIRAERRDSGQPLDGHSLADGLTRYSAKGEEYVRLIQAMISRFDLAAFDTAPGREA